jgi:hypothetical protein
MYEFEVCNKETNERTLFFGYNFKDACRRSNTDPDLWDVLTYEYID